MPYFAFWEGRGRLNQGYYIWSQSLRMSRSLPGREQGNGKGITDISSSVNRDLTVGV